MDDASDSIPGHVVLFDGFELQLSMCAFIVLIMSAIAQTAAAFFGR